MAFQTLVLTALCENRKLQFSAKFQPERMHFLFFVFFYGALSVVARGLAPRANNFSNPILWEEVRRETSNTISTSIDTYVKAIR